MSGLLRKLRNFRKNRHARKDKASNLARHAIPYQNGYTQPSTSSRHTPNGGLQDGPVTYKRTEELTTDLGRLDLENTTDHQQDRLRTRKINTQPENFSRHDAQFSGSRRAREDVFDDAAPSYSSGDDFPSQPRRSLVENKTGVERDRSLPNGSKDPRGLQTRPGNTTVHERIDPAVTHETIHKDVKHIRQEHITRDIHHHHVYHRVLPIVDVETLPARHFVPTENGLREVSEHELPGRITAQQPPLVDYTVNRQIDSGPVAGRHGFAPRKL